MLAPSREVFDIFDVGPVAGPPDDLDATSIAVFDNVADDKGLSIGDRVPVDFTATGPQEMTVGMIYGETRPPATGSSGSTPSPPTSPTRWTSRSS